MTMGRQQDSELRQVEVGPMRLRIVQPHGGIAQPLHTLTLAGGHGATLVVLDGDGREYLRVPAASEVTFVVGGSLGTHTIQALDAQDAELESLTFTVDAQTTLADDHGRFTELFEILRRTLCCYSPTGIEHITWRGRDYHYYCSWLLDHSHVAKGMKYFGSCNGEYVELEAQAQREDGMIWSFAFVDHAPEHQYHYWAYHQHGYARSDGELLFTRQPVENHCEYNYVDTLHFSWKASGDDGWMAQYLDSACKALEYSVTDRARYSSKYALLKRGCTIDSWDFQAHDAYLVPYLLGGAQMIDPDRTKFVIFNGDNTGYAYACEQLAEMLIRVGRTNEADVYRHRAGEIRDKLTRIAWNGRYFLHHVEEDPTAERNLGVDETTQIVMSNAYALNRNIPHAQCVAILNTYRDLSVNLPEGSPGEWYAIYPPFGKGFGADNGIWQYMNGGVHGHAAGELARGAFAHGFEQYGSDILLRLRSLAQRDNGMIRFAYTGAATPPPPAQQFIPITLSGVANMDLGSGHGMVPAWMDDFPGNDMRNLPIGMQTFADIPYHIADPATNDHRAAVAVCATNTKFPAEVTIPVEQQAGAIYLLHTASSISGSGVAGCLRFEYDDATTQSIYIQQGKHLVGWWMPHFTGIVDAGTAWRGANGVTGDVGVCWVAVANPQPEKQIARLVVVAAQDGAIYSILGVTLADRMPYHAPELASFGGPDNWSGGTCMAALLEGLAGVGEEATAFSAITLSPRWTSADVTTATVTVRYPASRGYVAYQYLHAATERTISLILTGGGDSANIRILLPKGVHTVREVTINQQPVVAQVENVEDSHYAVFPLALGAPANIQVAY